MATTVDGSQANLRRRGHRALPVVAGCDTTDGGASQARIRDVILVQDGKGEFWEEALAQRCK